MLSRIARRRPFAGRHERHAADKRQKASMKFCHDNQALFGDFSLIFLRRFGKNIGQRFLPGRSGFEKTYFLLANIEVFLL